MPVMNRLLTTTLFAGLILASPFESTEASAMQDSVTSLNGTWQFALDREDIGTEREWYNPEIDRSEWKNVTVPHTWQVEDGLHDYYGIAWYAKEARLDADGSTGTIMLEFDAVYRDADVWVNGYAVGKNYGSGWTPCTLDVSQVWKRDRPNIIVVRVDNRFSEQALPYKRSFDWAADGGIIRGVRLTVVPKTYLERLMVRAELNDDFTKANLIIRPVIRSAEAAGGLLCDLSIYAPGEQFVTRLEHPVDPIRPDDPVRVVIDHPLLWHFDFPGLYRVVCRLREGERIIHQKEAAIGIRRVEVKDGFYFLNGEPMRLMGVEWMPGSDPRYGMAEPFNLQREILTDMKRLNCLITRFHWQQADEVFEFCDRQGILVQEEVPAWGGTTMEGNLADLQRKHMRDMIVPHYNHPSIYAWGLCNEIGERNQALEFVKRGIDLARRLDPNRLLTHASNGLQADDIVSQAEMYASNFVDFIEWNDYYESWYGGTPRHVEANLDRLHRAFPGKSVVVSEYGLCECDPKNPSGDERRIEILRTHTDLYRNAPNVAGAIFFDYNDYRTHIGDKGQGSFQQRVHGVVDLFGSRKPSWEALRRESSPIKAIQLSPPRRAQSLSSVQIDIQTRSLENDMPAYTLRNYLLIWIVYNQSNQPVATGKRMLPDLNPGSRFTDRLEWQAFEDETKLWVEVFRPTGYSVHDAILWFEAPLGPSSTPPSDGDQKNDKYKKERYLVPELNYE